ncbi:hypothetical protein LTR85_010005 [Meristemomyces frigidus]|nr:hypothetical protein LTR85_010005 [Meristemomyces frigidus]
MLATEDGPYNLRLRHVLLTSNEVLALVKAFDDSVGELSVSLVASSDGNWHSIFKSMRSLEDLQSLQFDELGGAEVHEEYSVLNEGKKFNKRVRGKDGKIESYWVKEKSACMVGGKAVEAGLEVVLVYLAAHERPAARRGEGRGVSVVASYAVERWRDW